MPDFYKEKVNVGLLMAPTSTMVNNPSPIMKFISRPKIAKFLYDAAYAYFMYDTFPYNWYFSVAEEAYCQLLNGRICELMLSIFMGYDMFEVDNLKLDRYEVYLSYTPTDAGLATMQHYSQLLHTADGKPHFTRFDLGSDDLNFKRYKQTTPPDYSLQDIKVPLAIFSGHHDIFADPRDVAWLKDQVKDTIIFA